MRRALALLLVLSFSGPLIAPVFTDSIDQSALPACCRRNGKHHCMMYWMAMGRVPYPYRVIQDKCPYSPFAHLSILTFHGFFGESRRPAASHTSVAAASVRQAEAGYRISSHRTRNKRGPPQPFVL